MARRVTDADSRRIAEAINNLDYHDEIRDKDSFDSAYDDYFIDNEYFQNTPEIRKKVYVAFEGLYPNKAGDLFREAGGRSLTQDRRQDAKVIVTNPEEYKRRGANRVDLKGYDTRKKSVRKRFPKIGKIRGQVVYARGSYVKYRHGRKYVHRDRRGRFCSVKR